jgi:hypothetical protein
MKHSTSILFRAIGQGSFALLILIAAGIASYLLAPAFPQQGNEPTPAAFALIIGSLVAIWRGHVALESLSYWWMLRREERKRGIRYAIRHDQRL